MEIITCSMIDCRISRGSGSSVCLYARFQPYSTPLSTASDRTMYSLGFMVLFGFVYEIITNSQIHRTLRAGDLLCSPKEMHGRCRP